MEGGEGGWGAEFLVFLVSGIDTWPLAYYKSKTVKPTSSKHLLTLDEQINPLSFNIEKFCQTMYF